MTRARRGATAWRRGLAAEDAAAAMLEAQGWRVVARRLRTPHGELDLIAQDGATTVFVEIKARRTRETAAAAVSARQWTRLQAAALWWMAETGASGDMRFDVVLADASGALKRVENARAFDEW